VSTMCDREPKLLVEFIKSLPEFKIYTEIDGEYGHIGATLADAVLQSNNNYERNVRCRITRIRNVYRDDVTLHDLKRLLQRITVQEFLDWQGNRKPGTFLDLMALLDRENLDTEEDLKRWLTQDGSSAEKLLDIRFIGPKTVDYLKILVGLSVAAMDRHLIGFLKRAGMSVPSYKQGQEIIHHAADLMSLNRAHLDHSIWRHMSGSRASIPSTMSQPICSHSGYCSRKS
jgi:hypothetical protein